MFTAMLGDLPLLCHSKDMPLPFGKVFYKAMMHFNYIIKPQEQKILACSYLLHFMAHSTAALDANWQPSVNAIYPFLYDSDGLNEKKIGFIVIQVKNNLDPSWFGAKVFKKMDLWQCDLLNESDKDGSPFPISISYSHLPDIFITIRRCLNP